MIPLEQFGPIEQSSNLTLLLCILAFQSLRLVNKFLAATIAANLATLRLFVAWDDLLHGMTTQLQAFKQCDYFRCHSTVYKVF
ncbi:hypothetical protein TNCV_617571 [Trichonephila clavipes]|nr:hypothetical protein TNCV_617571 [Trichonephila clavipes]